MTAVTSDAVVQVTANVAMLRIHRRLVVSVTIHTREHRVVAGVRMAVVARGPLSSVGPRVNREFMRELRADPRGRRMAGLAGFRETRSSVVRIGDCGEFARMARIAIARRAGVLPIDMAAGAGSRRVHPGQREPGLAVIVRGAQPLRRGVAHLAVLRKARHHMVWRRRRRELAEVTGNACGVERRVLA